MAAIKLQLVGLAGLCLSGYALYVEHQSEVNPSYEAFCDISHEISCSKVFLSEWGRLFSALGLVRPGSALDLPNAALGLVYFSLVLMHPLLPLRSYQASAKAVFYLTLPVMAATALLAYVLLAVLKDVCIVCFSIYVCNALVLLLSYRRGFLAGKVKDT
ncbi:vitamin K epoxide reductase [Tribonema minus]|uniref:vitamin-K-epoxide reductase (warfarin-sensitive) n=1 Tax=Tribonema minus TaxID=303371 RepID=A0A835Z447_9STRA|nr:vitamin K epoxide reductase [Tribonema minus]